jgi:16S rRNA (uracil1498-N3)-methyltransferase
VQKWVCLLPENTVLKPNTYYEVLDEEFHYLKNVLRIKEGSMLLLRNGTGMLATGAVHTIEKKKLVLSIETYEHIEPHEKEKKNCCEFLIGLPKPATTEDVVAALSELGIKKINFFQSQNTQFKTDFTQTKVHKLQHIARESLRISKDTHSTKVELYNSLENFLGQIKPHQTIIFADEALQNTKPLSEVLKNTTSGGVCLAVGPEAGFSNLERESIKEFGAQSVNLGANILKVQTACVAMAGAYLF